MLNEEFLKKFACEFPKILHKMKEKFRRKIL